MEPPKHGTKTEDFMLAEYKYLADSFWRNEEVGERRVNFFITLVTAVISALVALATRSTDLPAGTVYAIIVFALFALLAFGIITLLRMIRRNQVTDGYKKSMDIVRTFFKDADTRLSNYEPFPKNERKLGRGGLAEMVAVFNGVIAGAIGVAVTMIAGIIWWAVVAIGLICFIAALALQVNFISRFKS